MLHLWGTFSYQFSHIMGHLPSHIFAALYEAFTIPHIPNGAFILPILGCFHCTLQLPSLWGVSIHTGHFSFLFYHLIIPLDSWGTYPSHIHFGSSNISHFRHTWSLILCPLTAHKYFLVRFIQSQFLFCLLSWILYIFIESCLSRLFINALQHEALNLPICIVLDYFPLLSIMGH